MVVAVAISAGGAVVEVRGISGGDADWPHQLTNSRGEPVVEDVKAAKYGGSLRGCHSTSRSH